MNAADQLALLAEFGRYSEDLPFGTTKKEGLRYYYQNDWFTWGDAIATYSMLRHFKPKRIIEVGSGFSSAVMLDTNERFLDYDIKFTFIEPFQKYRLLELLSPREAESANIVESRIQDVDPKLVETLEAGDILFIDSSHVAKFESDVNHILFELLPRLKKGVLIQFHDIPWPFEYPEEWLRLGWAWNEAYALHAFLQYNSAFSILLFNSYLGNLHSAELAKHTPVSLTDTGGSLWLCKN